MERLPEDLDLSLPESRLKIRSWMVRICNVVLKDAALDFSKAAAAAIEEAAALAIDPDYYLRREKRRKERRAATAARAVLNQSDDTKTKVELAFERLTDSTVKM